MPEQFIDEATAGSSAADQDENAAASSTAEPTDGITPDSSTGEGANEPSYQDIVSKALEAEESPPSEEDGEAKAKEPDPSEGKAEDADEELPDEPTEEELAEANPRTKRRMEQLLDQRKELREQVTGLESKARQWDNIEQFREQNGLSAEGVANAIQIAALIENEPDRAYQILEHIQVQLGQRTGATLPDDLREAVQRGEITRERAFELSKAQAQSRLFEERSRTADQRARQAQDTQQLQRHVDALGSVATSWDKAKSQSDPDWQMKRQEVATRVERRLQVEGFPQDAEGMKRILDEEATAVDGLIKQFRPQQRSIKPTPGGASPRDASPRQPKDHYDVVSMALEG